MRITLLQTALVWEKPGANRRRLAEKLETLSGHTDLVLLPEMFTTGFSMNAGALAEPMDGPTVQWMQEQAGQLGAALCGSFICRENDAFFNRLLFVRPGGDFSVYDKKHLFKLAGEHEHYTPGSRQVAVEWMGWRIRPLVCYDLRFPEWARNQPEAPYDLLLYVANWPERRAHHWRTLLPARAVENQAYVAALNIVGADGNGHAYAGDSAVIDFNGQPLAQLHGHEGVVTVPLERNPLLDFRQKLPFLADMDA
ncbi:MAG: amidohydrolase [Saprospiraceae bacterium]|nr:amidohydrolase [Saprospiraceae bacterium]